MDNLLDGKIWPVKAVSAVSVNITNRAFPQAWPNLYVEYFNSAEDFEAWLKKQDKMVSDSDYSFVVRFSYFEWDLGPNFRYGAEISEVYPLGHHPNMHQHHPNMHQ